MASDRTDWDWRPRNPPHEPVGGRHPHFLVGQFRVKDRQRFRHGAHRTVPQATTASASRRRKISVLPHNKHPPAGGFDASNRHLHSGEEHLGISKRRVCFRTYPCPGTDCWSGSDMCRLSPGYGPETPRRRTAASPSSKWRRPDPAGTGFSCAGSRYHTTVKLIPD